MPELPEVETVRAGLESRFRAPVVETAIVRDGRLRLPVVASDMQRLVGARILAFRRRAKYLLLDTDDGRSLVLHLGMSGSVVVAEPGAALGRHDHLVLGLRQQDESVQLRLRDPRRFGMALVVPTGDLAAHRLFSHLGPEPLGEEFTASGFAAVARCRRAPIKNFLMDARVVVGVGNIYASEALWRAGIHPTRAAGRVSRERLAQLRRAVREVLREAIAAGGTTLRDFRGSDGELGYFAIRLTAYDREGAPCARCGRAIRRIVQSGRATYYCPRCQR